MDEVDSIGSARSESGGGGGGGDSEVQRTMLELLNQLDGFEATNKIKARPRRGASCVKCRRMGLWVSGKGGEGQAVASCGSRGAAHIMWAATCPANQWRQELWQSTDVR